MANQLDYIAWRGDLTFAQDPFNEVDALNLSRLSCMSFKDILPRSVLGSITIKGAAERIKRVLNYKERFVAQDDRLLQAMAKSRRYGDLRLMKYFYHMDVALETQISGLVIELAECIYFVTFGGSDHSLVSWKEDFNMSFTTPIPAQKMARHLVNRLGEELSGEFILGGHSKGGNLSIFATAFSEPEVQSRIAEVYNFDGPGFNEEIITQPEYRSVSDRIKIFIPESSIVGLLLEHEGPYTVIKSHEPNRFRQHDNYSWEVKRDQFVYLDRVSGQSTFINNTLSDWLAAVDNEKREVFTNTLFKIITDTNATTLEDLNGQWLKKTTRIIQSLTSVDYETRTVLIHTLKLLIRTTRLQVNSGLARQLQELDRRDHNV